MDRFRYLRDPLFLTGCGLYAVNRWLLKPHFPGGFLHSHFNDLWLIPCALPPILWLHRRLGLRSHDHPPQALEVAGHLVFWSVLFEWIGPHFVVHTTGDPLDVMAYALGAIFAGLWWQRDRCVRIFSESDQAAREGSHQAGPLFGARRVRPASASPLHV